LKKKDLSLAIALLSLPLGAQESGFFDFFNEEMSPKIEVNIKTLNYERKTDEDQAQGHFSFDKFQILSEKTNLKLHNDSHFYDADIYRRGQMIGFHGPAASFVYQLRDQDFKYVDSFQWMTMKDVYYFMDRTEIILKGKNFAMREPQTMLLTNDFKLNCERHPNYQLNDGDGFIAGCFNYGSATALDGQGISTDFRFFDEESNKLIDLKGYFKKIDFHQEAIEADITSVTSNFSDEVILNATDIKLSCEKPRDVVSVTPEKLVVPCLGNINIEGNFLGAEFLEDKDELTLLNPKITHNKNVLTINHSDIRYKAKESEFSLTSSILKCKTPEDGNLVEMETFLSGCLNNSELFTKDEEVNFEFKIIEEQPKPFELVVGGDVQSFQASSERLNMRTEKLKLEIDNNIFIDFSEMELDCQKQSGLTKFDAKEMFAFCKKDLDINLDTLSLKDFIDPNKPVLVKTHPSIVKNQNELLHIKLPDLKLVDREDLTVMEDVRILCETKSDEDVFIPNEIIGACVKRGQINISKIFTDDSNLSVSTLMNSQTNIDDIKVEKDKPKIFDVSLITQNGKVHGKVMVHLLGLKSEVTFSGPISWDVEKEVLTIKVENSRLPLGIRSENIFMFFIKKMLVAEMISYEKDKTIKISL
jgi:hypothetical protein